MLFWVVWLFLVENVMKIGYISLIVWNFLDMIRYISNGSDLLYACNCYGSKLWRFDTRVGCCVFPTTNYFLIHVFTFYLYFNLISMVWIDTICTVFSNFDSDYFCFCLDALSQICSFNLVLVLFFARFTFSNKYFTKSIIKLFFFFYLLHSCDVHVPNILMGDIESRI